MSHIPAIYTLYLAMLILAFNGLYAKLIPVDPITITQLRCVIAAFAFVTFLSLPVSYTHLTLPTTPYV